MSSPVDLAGDVTVGVASSADPASVVIVGVVFREECGDIVVFPADCACDYDDYFYDGHYDEYTDYFDYDDPVDYDGYPSVYLLAATGSCAEVIACFVVPV